ncbi:MAG: hypothetical protein ACFFDT_28040, partial [Candidatus Hodarchaeota archaeon]
MTAKEYFEKKSNPEEEGTVFVLLAQEAEKVYEEYVKKAAEELNFQCESFIDTKGPGDALETIFGGIQKAEILIFD